MGIVDALVTWLVNVTFVLADFVKIAIGGTGGNSISILFNYQTGGGEGQQICVKSFFYIIVWFCLSIQVTFLQQ